MLKLAYEIGAVLAMDKTAGTRMQALQGAVAAAEERGAAPHILHYLRTRLASRAMGHETSQLMAERGLSRWSGLNELPGGKERWSTIFRNRFKARSNMSEAMGPRFDPERFRDLGSNADPLVKRMDMMRTYRSSSPQEILKASLQESQLGNSEPMAAVTQKFLRTPSAEMGRPYTPGLRTSFSNLGDAGKARRAAR